MNKLSELLTVFNSVSDYLNTHKGIDIRIYCMNGNTSVTLLKQNYYRGFDIDTRYSNWLEEAMLAFVQQCKKLEKDCEKGESKDGC